MTHGGFKFLSREFVTLTLILSRGHNLTRVTQRWISMELPLIPGSLFLDWRQWRHLTGTTTIGFSNHWCHFNLQTNKTNIFLSLKLYQSTIRQPSMKTNQNTSRWQNEHWISNSIYIKKQLNKPTTANQYKSNNKKKIIFLRINPFISLSRNNPHQESQNQSRTKNSRYQKSKNQWINNKPSWEYRNTNHINLNRNQWMDQNTFKKRKFTNWGKH